jgi:hypothetical protein
VTHGCALFSFHSGCVMVRCIAFHCRLSHAVEESNNCVIAAPSICNTDCLYDYLDNRDRLYSTVLAVSLSDTV